MSYASQADLVASFGSLEITQVTDRNRTGTIDADAVAQALADADELINSYLGERYTLPLPEVPRMVVSVACDIARHRLHKEGLHEEVRKRYEDALRWLKDVAAGRSGLGLPEGSEPVSRSGIRSGQAKSNFDWDRH